LKEDFFMQCPKCGHKIPDMNDKCLYCGAWTKGEAASGTGADSSRFMASSGKMGKNFAGVQVTKEEINYKKLEELPLPLRARVEAMLKKGEGQSEEIKTFFHNIPEPMDRTGEKRKKISFLAALKFFLKKE
jgi:hypothetical protein